MRTDAIEIKAVGQFGAVSSSTMGVFAISPIVAGSLLADLNDGELRTTRDFRTIEIDAGHSDHPVGRYINHSCAPSARIDKTRGLLVSLHDLSPEDEITFDYSASETEIARPFDCHCSSPACRGRVESQLSHAGI